jgi:hypothetical protein
MDGDGWLDVIVVIRDGDKVQAYRNNAGHLELSSEITVGRSPRELASADFNGDGCPDFAVVNRQSFDVSILIGCGGGAVGFQTLNQVLPVDGEVSGLQLHDLNGDGRADVIQAHRASSDVSVRLASTGGQLASPVFYPAGTGVSHLELADVNGDGHVDVLTASTGLEHLPGSLTVRMGTSGGTFGPALMTELPGPARPLAVKAADLDGDGKVDLALSFTDAQLALLRGAGDGTFAPVVPRPTGWPHFVFAVRQMAAGDFDQDGDMDLAGVGFYGELGVLTNDGGLLSAATYAPQRYGAGVINELHWYRARELRMEELTGDGDPDLVLGLDAGVLVFAGTGGTAFAPGHFSSSPGVPVIPGAAFAASGFAFGDYDGDGDRDMAVSCMANQCLTILARESGIPAWRVASEVRVPAADYIASGDIDGDGLADLAGSGRSALWLALSGSPAVAVPGGVALPVRSLEPKVVINEIMSSNTNTPLPLVGDRFSDWVELYNPLPVSVVMDGWTLEAREGRRVSTYAFPRDYAIGARTRRLVLCSEALGLAYPTTGWNLSGNGGTLLLRQPDGTIAEEVRWPEQRPNMTFARFSDGAAAWTTGNMASPGSPNVYTGSIQPVISFRGFDVPNFSPGTPIELYATAADDSAVIGVSLGYRRIDVAGSPWQRVRFYDDGLHDDGPAADGYFAGSIPDGFPATAQIEFYLEATDTSGLTVYDPAPPVAGEEVGGSSLYTLGFITEESPVEISEVVSSNSFWRQALGAATHDYIELQNRTTQPVDMTPYGLLDGNYDAADRYRFPAGYVLPPLGRCVVHCAGATALPWFSKFKLNSSGDTVYLQKIATGGSWLTVEKVVVPPTAELHQSWSRTVPGGAFQAWPMTPDRVNASTTEPVNVWVVPTGDPMDFPFRVYVVWNPGTSGGVLQSSTDPAGPWSNSTAMSTTPRPYTESMTAPRRFFRIHRP